MNRQPDIGLQRKKVYREGKREGREKGERREEIAERREIIERRERREEREIPANSRYALQSIIGLMVQHESSRESLR